LFGRFINVFPEFELYDSGSFCDGGTGWKVAGSWWQWRGGGPDADIVRSVAAAVAVAAISGSGSGQWQRSVAAAVAVAAISGAGLPSRTVALGYGTRSDALRAAAAARRGRWRPAVHRPPPAPPATPEHPAASGAAPPTRAAPSGGAVGRCEVMGGGLVRGGGR